MNITFELDDTNPNESNADDLFFILKENKDLLLQGKDLQRRVTEFQTVYKNMSDLNRHFARFGYTEEAMSLLENTNLPDHIKFPSNTENYYTDCFCTFYLEFLGSALNWLWDMIKRFVSWVVDFFTGKAKSTVTVGKSAEQILNETKAATKTAEQDRLVALFEDFKFVGPVQTAKQIETFIDALNKINWKTCLDQLSSKTLLSGGFYSQDEDDMRKEIESWINSAFFGNFLDVYDITYKLEIVSIPMTGTNWSGQPTISGVGTQFKIDKTKISNSDNAKTENHKTLKELGYKDPDDFVRIFEKLLKATDREVMDKSIRKTISVVKATMANVEKENRKPMNIISENIRIYKFNSQEERAGLESDLTLLKTQCTTAMNLQQFFIMIISTIVDISNGFVIGMTKTMEIYKKKAESGNGGKK